MLFFVIVAQCTCKSGPAIMVCQDSCDFFPCSFSVQQSNLQVTLSPIFSLSPILRSPFPRLLRIISLSYLCLESELFLQPGVMGIKPFEIGCARVEGISVNLFMYVSVRRIDAFHGARGQPAGNLEGGLHVNLDVIG